METNIKIIILLKSEVN